MPQWWFFSDRIIIRKARSHVRLEGIERVIDLKRMYKSFRNLPLSKKMSNAITRAVFIYLQY